MRHCPACGARLGLVTPVVCGACGAEHWRNAKPCAGGLVTRDGRLLLVRRAIDPWRGYWDIPGGFCEADEHPRETVTREVREEVGLDVAITGMLGIWMDTYGSAVGSSPPDATMNCYYHAVPVDDAEPLVDLDEASEAAWFAPDRLPSDLAFPDHAGQVLEAWRSAVASANARACDGGGSA
jgi:8-oxo-dGTP diphosphatase